MKHAIQVTFLFLVMLFAGRQAFADTLVSEARNVMDNVQNSGKHLNDEFVNFFSSFSSPAGKMVKLEAKIEELQTKGYLGKTYAESPEIFDRLFSEYARNMADIMELFMNAAPKIQIAASNFTHAVHQGKDRLSELRNDDTAIFQRELRNIKNTYQDLQQERAQMSRDCPEDSSNAANRCRREQMKLFRKFKKLKHELARLNMMNKVSNIRKSVAAKLESIFDTYVDQESEIVALLRDYSLAFESYAQFVAGQDIGQMMRKIKQIKNVEEGVRNFKTVLSGVEQQVTQMGKKMDSELDMLIGIGENGDAPMQARSDFLKSFDDQNVKVAKMIRDLDKEIYK